MLNFVPINIFGIGGLIYPYTILIGVGFIHLFFGFTWSAQNKNIASTDIEKIQLILVFSVFFGFLGASIGSQLLIKDANVALTTVTVIPGFCTGVLFMIFAMKLYHLNIIKWLNILVPYWCFAHGWGRIGCFLGGCCYGKPTESIFGVSFPVGSIPFHEHGYQNLHPTQIYEALILFFIGLLLLKPNFYRYRIVLFLVIYGTSRFFIEFLRDDIRGNIDFIYNLSPSQFFSIIYIFLGFLYLSTLFLNNKKSTN